MRKLREFAIFTMRGHKPLGILHAVDANVAGHLANQMHDGTAVVFPPSHMSQTERWAAQCVQDRADYNEDDTIRDFEEGAP